MGGLKGTIFERTTTGFLSRGCPAALRWGAGGWLGLGAGWDWGLAGTGGWLGLGAGWAPDEQPRVENVTPPFNCEKRTGPA